MAESEMHSAINIEGESDNLGGGRDDISNYTETSIIHVDGGLLEIERKMENLSNKSFHVIRLSDKSSGSIGKKRVKRSLIHASGNTSVKKLDSISGDSSSFDINNLISPNEMSSSGGFISVKRISSG